MNTTATYSDGNGTEVVFKKSLRNQMFYNHLIRVLLADKDASDLHARSQYLDVAAYAVKVKGLDWTPPKMGDSDKKIEASYQTFLDVVPDFDMFNAMYTVIDDLRKPVADEVQRPDETLTDEERADPN